MNRADPAGSLFHVWLQMINCVVEPGIPLPLQFSQPAGNSVRIPLVKDRQLDGRAANASRSPQRKARVQRANVEALYSAARAGMQSQPAPFPYGANRVTHSQNRVPQNSPTV